VAARRGTQASNTVEIADYPDWVVKLKDEEKMRCRLIAASPERYVVVFRSSITGPAPS
jgi:hypothetical protein